MKEFRKLGLLLAATLTMAVLPAEAQLLKGTVTAKEMPDISVNYSADGFMLNTVSKELEIGKDGTFTYNDELPAEAMDVSIYVSNDIFGVRLEKGKQVVINLKADESGEHFTAEISGDNVKESRFYNTYVQAFDIMKYFSPDPAEAKTSTEYRAILEEEYAKVLKALPTVKDKQLRSYYTRLSERMYTWTKLRILMDLAYDEKKKCSDYQEYNDLVATIDPNDEIDLKANLIYTWLSAQVDAPLEGDQTESYLKQMDVIDAKITNPKIKADMIQYLPYAFFSYGQAKKEGMEKFMAKFKVFAKDYPDLVSQYEEKVKATVDITAGMEAPYLPVLTRPDGTTCKLADFKGKIIYIDVWATWCGPCCKEIPHLEKVVEQMKDNKDIRFISVSVDENLDAWKAKLANDNPQWEQYVLSKEEEQTFMTKWNIAGIPRFIILDREGRVINANAPRPSNPDLVKTLEELAK